MTARPIVLDANILIRYVIGARVPALLAAHADVIDFLAPDTAFEEARRHLPTILRARGGPAAIQAAALTALDAATSITPVPASSDERLRLRSLARIGQRDADDRPVLACALMLDRPIWTEDHDFFGAGVPTSTTALVELYFSTPDLRADEH